MSDNYQTFLNSKKFKDSISGFDVPDDHLKPPFPGLELFDFQKAIVKWALKRGRAAIFADTGLGKTAMQAIWAHNVWQYSGGRVLILAPLCVAKQTVQEADKFGVTVKYAHDEDDTKQTGIYVTNYDRLDLFPSIETWFEGLVLDESSIIKHHDSKTRQTLINTTRRIPYKLSCTATPSPNDYVELGNQAEFLGVMSMVEMLATFFTHDSGETAKWRLKGHAAIKFWEWLSKWAVMIQSPSDIGFDGSRYKLPPIELHYVKIKSENRIEGELFPIEAKTLSERISARRVTVNERINETKKIIERLKANGPVLVWCNLNSESDLLARSIPDAVEVKGSDHNDQKEERLLGFADNKYPILITKPSIAGFGMNWQNCSQMVFVGLNDSYEQVYQAIRRCYRFGQTKPVSVTFIFADIEGNVVVNLKRKEEQASEMTKQMIGQMKDFMKNEIESTKKQTNEYKRDIAIGTNWILHLGDCIDVAREIESESIGYSLFSPPFSSLYTYSNSDRDMGNSTGDLQFFTHFEFLAAELFRILKPGRNLSMHVMNLPTTKTVHGHIGIRDFRGECIRLFEKAGFYYHSEVTIWKDPVVAMQRTKALGLLHKQIKKDSAMSRQGIPDYVVTFRKPGINLDPISHTADEFPVKQWQEYASPVWMDIQQSNTLNRELARENEDERHIAPLQLDVIERCLKLWSKERDLVFSPFAGIGSEGYVAIKLGRRFVGSELKESYFKLACKHLSSVVGNNSQGCLF